MPGASPSTPTVRRAAFTADAERARLLSEVLDYIEDRHMSIDPDMFDIDLAQVAALKRLFASTDDDAHAPGAVSLTYRDLFALETMVMAADTYSHRHGQPPVYGVTDAQLAGLQEWLTQALAWFTTPFKEEA